MPTLTNMCPDCKTIELASGATDSAGTINFELNNSLDRSMLCFVHFAQSLSSPPSVVVSGDGGFFAAACRPTGFAIVVSADRGIRSLSYRVN
jgi:hypothetical protein